MALVAEITPRDVPDDVLRIKLNELIRTVNLSDLNLEIPAGNVSGKTAVNKFGRSTNVDSGIDTDIWDRANATNDQDIWIAPTQARIHAIASNSSSDDGNSGVGARTLRIYGLTSWTTKEVSEDITLNGVTGVNTVNSYVIIHRMKVLTKGATNVNVGTITATAASDGTVTAQINPGQGQTQMAIYGFPSIQTAYLTDYYVSMNKAGGGAARLDVVLLYNPEPETELLNYVVKSTLALQDTGQVFIQREPRPYVKFSGPGILKIQSSASKADQDVSAGFDLILVDN